MSELRTRDGGSLALALNEISKRYNVEATIIGRGRTVHQWGYNESSVSGVFETVKDGGGTETLLTTNAITVADSTSASDTMTMTVEGHYLDADDNLVEHEQTVTLTGTTAVTLSQPLARVDHMFVSSGEVNAVGTVTLNVGEGGTAYAQIEAGSSTTERASLSTSHADFFLITGFGGTMLASNNQSAQFRLDIKPENGTFRPQARWLCGGGNVDYDRITASPVIIVPPNSDIRIQSKASASSEEIGAYFEGYYAIDTALINEAPPAPA